MSNPLFRPANWLIVALLPVVAPFTVMLTAGLSCLAVVTSALTSSVLFFRLILFTAEFGFSLSLSYAGWITKTSVDCMAGRMWGWNNVERERDEQLLAMTRNRKPKKGSDTEDEKFLEALVRQEKKRQTTTASNKFNGRIYAPIKLPAHIDVSRPAVAPQRRPGAKERPPKSPACRERRRWSGYDVKKWSPEEFN